MSYQSHTVSETTHASVPPDVRVIHVDDADGMTNLSAEYLPSIDSQISVTPVQQPNDVIERVQAEDAHCVLSDYEMPQLDGLTLFERLRGAGVDVPFILSTGKGSEKIASEAMTAGVTDYFQKGRPNVYELVANRIIDAVRSQRLDLLPRLKAWDSHGTAPLG